MTGVMQDYYEQYIFNVVLNTFLKISFAGTIVSACINISGPFAQVLVSIFGIRPVLIVGTILITLGLELASLNSQIWHLYLTQDVLFGIGSSVIYMVMMGVAPQWFAKRRGLALDIMAGGSGIGGLVIPNTINAINSSLGHQWTYRILGSNCLHCDIWACILVKPKNPSPKTRKCLSEMIDLNVLRNTDFLLFCLDSNIGLFSYSVLYFYLSSYATHIGLSDSQDSSVISVSAAGNFKLDIHCHN
ncbi:unnamed protein product [Rhizopus stolonifer]